MINHIVLFKIKKDVEKVLVELMEAKFLRLKEKISEIKEISGGKNISFEEKDKGYTKGYSLIFNNEEDVKNYVNSSEHLDFVNDYVKPITEDVIVFDYEVK